LPRVAGTPADVGDLARSQEATMTIQMTMNVLAALSSFAFVAAVVLGMI
jgi:hypothetical protein